MTYCLALKAEQGLVLASDSRTNAGFDNVSTYGKSFYWQVPGERVIMLMCAGNLATSHSVVRCLEEAWKQQNTPLHSAATLYDLAEWLGQISVEQRDKTIAGGSDPSQSGSSFILAGQVHGQPSEVRLIYPEGNNIPVSEQYPWLHIGEFQVAHALLHLLCSPPMTLAVAEHVALMAMNAVRRSHLSVGAPMTLNAYADDSLCLAAPYPLSLDEEDLLNLEKIWVPQIHILLTSMGSRSISESLGKLPPLVQQSS